MKLTEEILMRLRGRVIPFLVQVTVGLIAIAIYGNIGREGTTVSADAVGQSVLTAPPLACDPGAPIQRVNVSSSGAQTTSGVNSYVWLETVSADGRHIVFESAADNLAPNITNGSTSDVFLRDRLTCTTTRISAPYNGINEANDSFKPSISPNGRFIVFTSLANNLVPGDTNPRGDVFLYDRQTATLENITVMAGITAQDGFSPAYVSPSGRYVGFAHWIDILQPYHSVYDRQTDTIHDTSRTSGGVWTYQITSEFLNDERYIVFSSIGKDLVPNDSDSDEDFFLYDWRARTVMLLKLTFDGQPINGNLGDLPYFDITPDGRYLAFSSGSLQQIVPGSPDSPGLTIYVRDVLTGTVERISPPNSTMYAHSGFTEISDDGRYVTFESSYPNYSTGHFLHVRDRQTGTLTRTLQDDFVFPQLSADGRVIVVQSYASDLVPNDTNNALDVFAHLWQPPSSSTATPTATPTPTRTPTATTPAISGNDGIGLYNPANALWLLRNALTTGDPNTILLYGGIAGGLPLTGDWNGDGIDTPGIYVPSLAYWFLRNSNTTGIGEVFAVYGGIPGALPVVGDWDGNGTDTIGLYVPATGQFLLRNSNTTGNPDVSFVFGGIPGAIPVVGDWDGNGTDTIGLYVASTAFWLLRNTNNTGDADTTLVYGGIAGGLPLVGDWNNDGVDTVGMYVPSLAYWFLRNSNTTGTGQIFLVYGGITGALPVVGQWASGGMMSPGVGIDPQAEVTLTPMLEPSATPTFTGTPTATESPTASPTATESLTMPPTETYTGTPTPTETETPTMQPTETPTVTETPTAVSTEDSIRTPETGSP